MFNILLILLIWLNIINKILNVDHSIDANNKKQNCLSLLFNFGYI